MKTAKKIVLLATLALVLVGMTSSCRAGGCGGCPTWSLETAE